MFVPDQPKTLKHQIADEIKRRIVAGELKFGQKISENLLAEELGTKRAAVREAFLLLQGEELLHVEPQKGTFVFTVTEEEIREICEHRLILESASLRLIAERNRDVFLNEAQALLEKHRTALEANDIAQCGQYDAKFHELIIACTNNRSIISSYATLSNRAWAVRSRSFFSSKEARRVFGNHQDIIQAFANGDMESCMKALSSHIYTLVTRMATEPEFYTRFVQTP